MSLAPYRISIQLNSSQTPLVDWNQVDNVEVSQCVIKDSDNESITRTLPMWEKFWGSLVSPTVQYDSETPILIWFSYGVEACRSLHGKIVFKDGTGKELAVKYLDDTANGSTDLTNYPVFAKPPEGTKQIIVQFLAKHREVFSKDAKYEVANFQMWKETDAIGIDAIAVREEVANSPTIWLRLG